MPTYQVSGTVLQNGAVSDQHVFLHDATTGELVAEGDCNPVNGDFVITVPSADPVYVTAVPDAGFLPAMKGAITPETV